jgi:hypothetical protein
VLLTFSYQLTKLPNYRGARRALRVAGWELPILRSNGTACIETETKFSVLAGIPA